MSGRPSVLAVLAAAGALALAGAASAGLAVGVNDDAPKDPAVAPWFYAMMQETGLRIDTLTLLWDESAPGEIAGAALADEALDAAAAAGVTVELDLYPAHSTAFTHGVRCRVSSDPEACGDSARIRQFGAWAAAVAQRFPSVTQFVVMNECNQPRFVNPQWDVSGANQSAGICGRALAAAYDAIKAVSRTATVWGVGLSPRGNDNPHARSNSSTKPVTFVAALGAWFRAFVRKTHRTAGLMDGFDYHPYPVPQTQPFERGYADPKEAGVANLPRIYEAFYQAFAGTPQRTIGQQRGGGLGVSLNETGVQTAAARPGYVGIEVSGTGSGGVLGDYAGEGYQARWYRRMLDLLACDPNVRFVNIFHLVDEADLAGWQSGLYFVDRTPKLAARTVRSWIAATGGGCRGRARPWSPSPAAALTPPALPRAAGAARALPAQAP
ncbi:MAG TPA: hypothetical protein VFA66_00110 [Gaiellaceae bacterium]|nr:hypothetical protein [Gaiellaceae bacterium]